MGLGNKENIRQIKPDWRSQCRSRLGGIPSCVNTFLLRFENHSQSFPLLTLKLHYNGANTSPNLGQPLPKPGLNVVISLCSVAKKRIGGTRPPAMIATLFAATATAAHGSLFPPSPQSADGRTDDVMFGQQLAAAERASEAIATCIWPPLQRLSVGQIIIEENASHNTRCRLMK